MTMNSEAIRAIAETAQLRKARRQCQRIADALMRITCISDGTNLIWLLGIEGSSTNRQAVHEWVLTRYEQMAVDGEVPALPTIHAAFLRHLEGRRDEFDV